MEHGKDLHWDEMLQAFKDRLVKKDMEEDGEMNYLKVRRYKQETEEQKERIHEWIRGLRGRIEANLTPNEVGHLAPPKEVGMVFASLGNACQLLGNFSQAIEYQTQYLAIAKEVGDREGEGGAYLSIGNAYMSLGDLLKAIEYHKQGLAIAEEVGDRVGESKAYGILGVAYQSQGHFHRAIDYHEGGEDIQGRRTTRWVRAWLTASSALATCTWETTSEPSPTMNNIMRWQHNLRWRTSRSKQRRV
jgi:tetratricopeptide (TPR) repeat protein